MRVPFRKVLPPSVAIRTELRMTQSLHASAQPQPPAVSKLWTQTVLAPVVSSILFILVFGLSLGRCYTFGYLVGRQVAKL